MNYLPHIVKKGEAFRLYFSQDDSFGSGQVVDWDNAHFFISKDGGQFDRTVNTPVAIALDPDEHPSLTRTAGYIDLTADETNCNSFVISITESTDGSASNRSFMGFYTSGTDFSQPNLGTAGAGLSLNDTVTDIVDGPIVDPTIGEVLSFLYQYIRKRRDGHRFNLKEFIRRF